MRMFCGRVAAAAPTRMFCGRVAAAAPTRMFGEHYGADAADASPSRRRPSPRRSEQHMAGGSQGSVDREAGNLVRGTSNVHVADLSAVPLPRVSPQMTAYLTGYHVGRTLYS